MNIITKFSPLQSVRIVPLDNIAGRVWNIVIRPGNPFTVWYLVEWWADGKQSSCEVLENDLIECK